jgi:hypothetical protein
MIARMGGHVRHVVMASAVAIAVVAIWLTVALFLVTPVKAPSSSDLAPFNGIPNIFGPIAVGPAHPSDAPLPVEHPAPAA